jgi:CheY-like chemotaxis protein
MPTESSNKVVAVLDDLMFTVKINESAKRAGRPVVFVKSEKDALDQAAQFPALMIVDLNCGAVDPLQLIRNLKTDEELRKIRVIGYVSHVQGDLKQAAQQAGCDMVLARSAFSQNLEQLLRK